MPRVVNVARQGQNVEAAMFDSKHAGVVLAGAVALAGCDPKDVFEWLHGHGHDGGHGGGGHGGHGDPCPPEECGDGQYRDTSGSCRRSATGLSAGFQYACAILSGGALKCWGSNLDQRLGYAPSMATALGDQAGEMGNALLAVPLGAGRTAVQVAAGSDLTCAVLNTGGVKCWGYNGYGTATGVHNEPLPSTDMLIERTFGTRHALEVGSGSGAGYALLDDGSVVQIYESAFAMDFGAGRLGVTFERSSRYDNWHICMVLDTGEVACKGQYEGGGGESGQLGRDPAGDGSPMPAAGYPLVDLGVDRTATDVALGDAHTCALLDAGEVKCWGANGYGQLGQDDTQNRGLLPAQMGDALLPVALGRPATAITAGRNYSCALLDDGSVKCWGRNDEGQLGIGSSGHMGNGPGEMATLPTGRTAVAIDAGTSTCALLDNGALKCWGGNGHGELGQGDTVTRGSAAGQLGDALPFIDLGT